MQNRLLYILLGLVAAILIIRAYALATLRRNSEDMPGWSASVSFSNCARVTTVWHGSP